MQKRHHFYETEKVNIQFIFSILNLKCIEVL